jgi:hypothetical protein
MARVEAITQGSHGLLQFRSWRDEGNQPPGRPVDVESREAVEAALPQIMGLSGERSDDWTERPDEVLRLTELKLSRYSEEATPAGG